jgi:hypothetical protein
MFSKNTERVVLSEVTKYLKNISPDSRYWKGKHSWAEMVYFRSAMSKRKSKFGFSKSDQIEVLRWGGINRFNQFELMKEGLTSLTKGEEVFSRISSMSKLFSFYNPNLYFILDARVALTINHLISLKNTKDKFIPFTPSKSRGEKVKKALIQLTSNNNYNDIGIAYVAYNSLILSIFNQITIPNGLPQKPEIIEMALFSMAEGIAEIYLNLK